MTNIVNIIASLSDKITNSTSEQEILYLSKAIEKIKVGNVKLVNAIQDMYDGVSSFGELYFVETENSLYFSLDSNRILLINDELVSYGWGSDGYGKVGANDDSFSSFSNPVLVAGGFTDWIQLSGGLDHTLGIRANGTAWAWGRGSNGRLGDNITITRSSPVLVVGNFTDWTQVSAGGEHSLGLRANGTAWAWGSNASGQIGDNTTVSKSSPVSVVGGFTDWIQLDSGGTHSLGLRANGTAWAWGNGSNGRLGNGNTDSSSSPITVLGNFTDWTQLSSGTNHSLGLRANGTAWAWGWNIVGRLGDGTFDDRSSPVSIVGGFTDWIQVSGGGDHSIGLRSNNNTNTIWAWGSNIRGALGDNTPGGTFNPPSKNSPVSVVGGFTDWIQVSAGSNHNLGLRANGTVWAWGSDFYSQLGDTNVGDKSSPVSVSTAFTDWIQVSTGSNHSLAIRSFR